MSRILAWAVLDVTGLALDRGEVDLERRALAEFAVDRDTAAVLLHDAVDRRQAESGAAALVLGGEEGLEEVRLCLGVHAVHRCR